MKVEVLGCSGGMGAGEYTTCVRINDQLLIDAGSGLGTLSQSEMLKIQQVYLTHAHLDHVCFLPLLLDNLFEQLHSPLQVCALPEVIAVLKTHLFNWSIWPDFTTLPNTQSPVLEFVPVDRAYAVVAGVKQVSPIKAHHVVPACGYRIESDEGKVFCFSGDTSFDPQVVDAYDQLGSIDCLMLECAFPDRLQHIADQSRHLTPHSLAGFIRSLKKPPGALWITHLKPAFRDEIQAQLTQCKLPVDLKFLSSGDTFIL
ncbi:MAG: 3',5'-cyclic-nucleotide phosphodiesterase [Nitrincola lacisaponensis]|uniref:cAMP phosphodiesterases class-II:Metallo-beta-lactamase superfamily n=1 Tax=Nitrincola lacisaponensis TaxID=267850 RepID=A0A063Y458_9GAMM|nr:3',5'-cyclic-nucleotide phosphodiesterase [Nitrincola lacisaponensis]KDE39322.1 CAMP phosphodiesterases class-II:Metallo-beta-lactamase superfamily [Nitrincola lacisaponensis]